MTDKEVKLAIQSAIKDFSKETLTDQAIHLFKTLGYNTERQNPFPQKNYHFFKESFLDGDSRFNQEKALVKEWKSVDLLFQLTRDEVSDQKSIFGSGKVKWEGEDKETVIETYLFFAIELIKTDYSRSALAQITREINKIFPMPVMLLFKYGEHLTLSVVNRRLHKKDEQKDVLEKVTLIKDISIQNPHRAHIEILFDLSFEELKRLHKFTNFVELHNAWQKTLDTKELNKRFYRELSNWYFWAINNVSFPNDIDDDKDDTVFNSESIIRLLTRLIFIWFIKEKNLIPDKIFEEKEVSKLIKGFKTKGSTVYYRAILQNLFFATLNQKIEERVFATDGTFEQNKKNYGIKNLYRYSSDFAISKDEVIQLFERVPFLNGGLFDCLDSEDESGKVMYLDGFSRNPKKQAQVPDELFFSQEKIVDLSAVYDDKKKKNEKVKGLFEIFNHYKFTITENTPIEEEVALDPELLGRVFENLLASYNPETKTTARKQTGSFYTPREIVNYMVDESLKAYLKQKLETEAGMKPEDAEIGLEFLLGYNERDHLFNEKEILILIKAIDNCKILDPACGSGAFPMGILHKLVYILHKLDPQNKLWEERQLEKVDNLIKEAGNINDSAIRDKIIEDLEVNKKDIEESFAHNELDYGRKLYLIESCIYGVDIQPIATQISKLRFFISLIVDQKADKTKVNFGIRPLPNLETKFVAANTLIGIDKPKAQGSLFDNQKVKELEEKLKDVRHRLFSAKTPAIKRKLREEDQKLREEMGSLLEKLMNQEMQEQIDNSREKKEIEYYTGLIQKNGEKPEHLNEIIKREEKLNKFKNEFQSKNHETARQLVTWDPYNQNASNPWFDLEWMFGVTDGFDVVVGNPPYVEAKKLKEVSQILRRYYSTYSGTADLYVYFYENGIRLLRENGTLIFITSNKFIKTSYGENLRKYFTSYNINEIIDFTDVHVFEALVASCIFSVSKNKIIDNNIKIAFANDTLLDFSYLINFVEHNKFYLNQNSLSEKIWQLEDETRLSLKVKIENGSLLLSELKTINIFRGVTTGYNPAFIIDAEKRKELIKKQKENMDITKPLLQGRNIRKWIFNKSNEYLIFIPWHFPLHIEKNISGASVQAENMLKKKYPSLYEHLEKYKNELANRNKDETGIRYEWYALQRCAASYYFEFEKEKIIWGLTSDKWTFAYDNACNFLPSNGYILTSSEIPIKYLLGLINSRLMEFYFSYIGIMTAGGAFTLKQETVSEFPIKIIDLKNQSKFILLVDCILFQKKQNQDTFFFEALIDSMVYELYFPEEIKAADVEVLKHLINLPELKDDWSNEKKLKTIEEVYKKLSDPNRPISIAMEKQKTVPEVRIIEGLPTLSEIEGDK